jgi:EAL domain-containing protein (putative c-di-GMP-specific phosphodiesterase class I)
MNMEVVAEGAPNLATIDLLRRLKCDRVQSYAVASPMSADELRRFVSGVWLEGHKFVSGGANLKPV